MNPIRIDPQILNGTPCFAGTRVPIQNLFDYLEDAQAVEEFLKGFPTVSREQVIELLELAGSRLIPRETVCCSSAGLR